MSCPREGNLELLTNISFLLFCSDSFSLKLNAVRDSYSLFFCFLFFSWLLYVGPFPGWHYLTQNYCSLLAPNELSHIFILYKHISGFQCSKSGYLIDFLGLACPLPGGERRSGGTFATQENLELFICHPVMYMWHYLHVHQVFC